MPKKTNRKVVLRIFHLQQQDLKLQEIEDRLAGEFEESLVPDLSTISRHVRRHKEEVPEELKQDVPFTWATMSEVPWEHSRVVLNIWAYYMSLKMDQSYGPFTRRLAKWSWRVVRAVREQKRGAVTQEEGAQQDISSDLPLDAVIKEPTEGDVMFVALEYTWREIASVVLGEPFDTRDLDMWLAFTPWSGHEFIDNYHNVKYPSEFTESKQGVPIRWHLLDLEWLDKVVPIVAMNRRSQFPDSVEQKPLPLNSPYDKQLYRAWSVLTDGLLGSQVQHYLAFLKQNTGQKTQLEESTPRPWYFDYLDEVKALGDPATYRKDNFGDEG